MEGLFCRPWSPENVVIGFAFSILVGCVAAGGIVWSMRLLAGPRYKWDWGQELQAAIVGIVERFAITCIAMHDVKSAGTFAVAWMGAKLLSGWNRPAAFRRRPDPNDKRAEGALSSMVGTLVSAICAIVGAGIVCSSKIEAVEMINPQSVNTLGLALDIIGAAVLAYQLIVSKDTAIALGVMRISADKKQDNLRLPAVADRIAQSKFAVIGVFILALGFGCQIWATWMQ